MKMKPILKGNIMSNYKEKNEVVEFTEEQEYQIAEWFFSPNPVHQATTPDFIKELLKDSKNLGGVL